MTNRDNIKLPLKRQSVFRRTNKGAPPPIRIELFLVSIVAFVARMPLLGVLSGDAISFLLPWHQQISDAGIQSLGLQVGNYGMPYQLLIFIGTLLPIDPLLWYKLTSIAFDYILAGQAYCLTREITSNRNRATLAYSAILFLPPVFLDSAAWAQCDSIYVSFVLASIRKLLAGKQRLAFFLLGIALSFKLQACFAVPFYFYFCITRKTFNPLDLLLLVGGFYLLSIPGVLSGRSIADPIRIYLSQTTTYPMMYLNYPSFWVMPNGDYKSLKVIAIGATALILAIEIAFLYRKSIASPNHLQDQIKIAALLVWTCLEFLPAMHERYGYLVTVLMTIAALVSNHPKIEVFCLGCLLVCDCATYGNYLFGASFDLLPLSLLHFTSWAVYLGSCLATPGPPSRKKAAP